MMIRYCEFVQTCISHWTKNYFNLYYFVQKKQESKAPDKDAILKATANLSTRHSDRTVTQHNIRDVSRNVLGNGAETQFFMQDQKKNSVQQKTS